MPRLNAPNMMVLDSLQDSEISSSSVGGLYFGPTAVFIGVFWCLFSSQQKTKLSIISFSLYCSLSNLS